MHSPRGQQDGQLLFPGAGLLQETSQSATLESSLFSSDDLYPHSQYILKSMEQLVSFPETLKEQENASSTPSAAVSSLGSMVRITPQLLASDNQTKIICFL
jgi:hypothetical protein